jgi:glycosyltransferase involved in cell wall biosynthesis
MLNSTPYISRDRISAAFEAEAPPAQQMKITCLVKHWGHHTPSGGYDKLAGAVRANIVKRKDISGLLPRIANKLWRRTHSKTADYLCDYQFGDWLAELNALALSQWPPPDVLHVLYGDEQLDLLLRWRSFLRCPLVATFHLPSDHASRRFQYFHHGLAKSIDAAVVVATTEMAAFEKWLDPSKVVYIPHGIDTDRFCSKRRQPDLSRFKLLIVGEHMRDWSVMHRLIDEANSLHLPIDFQVVTRESYFSYFTGCANVSLHTNISEEDLIDLYCGADILFVPVTNATANNSILEALACGTPVISTQIGGIPDYVDEDCAWLFPRGEVAPVLELVKRMVWDRDIAESRRQAARFRALKFDWRQVAKQMSVVYSAVAEGRSPAEAIKEYRMDGDNS